VPDALDSPRDKRNLDSEVKIPTYWRGVAPRPALLDWRGNYARRGSIAAQRLRRRWRLRISVRSWSGMAGGC